MGSIRRKNFQLLLQIVAKISSKIIFNVFSTGTRTAASFPLEN